MICQTAKPADFTRAQVTLNTPSPVGLLGFGMTIVLLNLHYAGVFPLNIQILGMGIFYGGLGLVIVGIMDWKRNNLFGAIIFGAFGLFWLSLIALLVLPASGLGAPPQPAAIIAYLTMWGFFSAILCFGAFRINIAIQVVFGSLALVFFLFAIGDAAGDPMIKTAGGILGLISGISAVYAGVAGIVNEIYGRTLLPLGEMTRASFPS